MEDFKYEVAISFLQEDEELAIRIHDILCKKYSTFIYSKKQEKLVGSDGEEEFNSIFGKQSRIVIVLYRDKWGETSWTRIEKNAIRNRSFDKGYDFVLFVKLDTTSRMPEWLPKTSIYQDYKRYGIEGLGSVVDRMIQRFGGSPTYETTLEKAKRYEEELSAEKELIRFLGSTDGVKKSKQEYYNLTEKLKEKIEEIQRKTENWHFNIKDEKHGKIELTTYGHTLKIGWNISFSNSLDDSVLAIQLFNGIFGGYRNNPQKIKTEEYDFTKDKFGSFGWKRRNDKKFYTNKNLIDYWFDKLVDIGFKKRKKDHI